MSGLFPKAPKVQPPNAAPPPLERGSDDIARLAAEQRSVRSNGGRASSMLTGGQGVGSMVTRFLGGAART